jgi:hypothetical protein
MIEEQKKPKELIVEAGNSKIIPAINIQHINTTPFEFDEIPDPIVEYIKKSSKISIRNNQQIIEKYLYSVTDITGCLRQSFYRIQGVDPDSSQFIFEDAWAIQTGICLHNNLTYASKWSELDIEKPIEYNDIDETLFICGRLDLYDYKKKEIADLKKVNAVKWQIEKGFIPKEEDALKIQCYGTIFRDTIPVTNLSLLYLDLKNIFAFKVPLTDRMEWIRERVYQLHLSINITKAAPPAEPSSACLYCKYKQRCEQQDLIKRTHSGTFVK